VIGRIITHGARLGVCPSLTVCRACAPSRNCGTLWALDTRAPMPFGTYLTRVRSHGLYSMGSVSLRSARSGSQSARPSVVSSRRQRPRSRVLDQSDVGWLIVALCSANLKGPQPQSMAWRTNAVSYEPSFTKVPEWQVVVATQDQYLRESAFSGDSR